MSKLLVARITGNCYRAASIRTLCLARPHRMHGLRMGEISLDGIADLASDFKASVTATAIRTIRMTRQPLILVAHDLLGRNWQWPSITAGGMRVRDDVDSRSSAFISMVGGNKAASARKEPASYWFDRRHVEQFDLRVQSFRTIEGEVLTLIRLLDPRMIEIYG
jgi:hypothetical protein